MRLNHLLPIALSLLTALSLNAQQPHRVVMVQKFPLTAPFYNTIQEDFFDLVYTYSYETRFFLPYRPKHSKGTFAFRYKRDGTLLMLDDKDLLIFLARNNLPTPTKNYTLAVDWLGYTVPIFLLPIFLVPIFLLFRVQCKFKNTAKKEKNPGYLRRKKRFIDYFK